MSAQVTCCEKRLGSRAAPRGTRRRSDKPVAAVDPRDLALELSQQGIGVYDSRQQLKFFNRRYAEIYGLEPGALRIGMPLREVVDLRYRAGTGPKMSAAEYSAWLDRLVKTTSGSDSEIAMSNGSIYSLRHQPTPDGGFIGFFTDITEHHRAERRIQHMAQHDALTGLANRVLFFEHLDRAIVWQQGNIPLTDQRAPPTAEDRLLGIMSLDLDGFKTVNDTVGHGAGDELLQHAARRIKSCIRDTDVLARLGGDEFALILDRGVSGVHQVEAVAERIIAAIAEPFAVAGQEITINITIGFTTVDSRVSPVSSAVLLSQADLALCHAKAQHGGTCCAFVAGMDVVLLRRTELERDLRRALSEQALDVHFQPILDLANRRVIGAEALVRWFHPRLGPIPPSEFIPVAEAAGLIVELGTWVLHTACRFAAGWGDIRIAVNLSPEQIRRGDLIDVVASVLNDTGLAPGRLELEVTEGMLLQETEATAETLRHVRSLGIRIALDDFGTGYSSLSYLRRFPFSKLKIDRSFIEPMQTDPGTAAIVRAIASLGHSLNMRVVAEGLETEAQMETVRALGCDEGQGYLLGRPCSAERFGQLLLAEAVGAEGLVG